MNHNRIRIDGPLIPHPFINLICREYPARIAYQKQKDLKFDGRYLYRPVINGNAYRILIYLQAKSSIGVKGFVM